MKALLTLPIAFLLAVPATAQAPEPVPVHGQHFAGLPPVRFWGEGMGVVFFKADVSTMCGKAPEGYVRLGCAWTTESGTPVMVLPLPQNYGEQVSYEVLVVHELGHWNGWGGNHEL